MSGHRGSQLWLLLVRGAVAGAAAQLAALAVNASAGVQHGWPGWLDLIRRFPFWSALALTAMVVVVDVALSLVRDRASNRGGFPPAPSATVVPGWIVDRPAEVDQIVRSLWDRGGRAVGITTGLQGAGGFGKTTLAALVCADRRVQRRFRGRIYMVTVGRDVRGREAITAKVAEVTRFITGDRETFKDPGLAGAHLGRLLDQRPRMLLVIDDGWEADQLAPFLQGGRKCVRLVTTRIPAVLPPGGVAVRVDQMSSAQARSVLTWELPVMSARVVEDLLAVTGRWPLLLRLVNRVLAAEVAAGRGVSEAGAELLGRLRTGGPEVVDELTGAIRTLNLDVPDERASAVRATIEASTACWPSCGR